MYLWAHNYKDSDTVSALGLARRSWIRLRKQSDTALQTAGFTEKIQNYDYGCDDVKLG